MNNGERLPPGWYRCVGGPFDGGSILPGDDLPEGGEVTICRVVMRTWGELLIRGYYVRTNGKLVWEAA